MPPTVILEIRSVGEPLPTGTPWPSLPQIPGQMSKSAADQVRAADLDIWPGICGQDGQGVPVGSGSPTLRISRITVGGTGA